MTIDITVPLGTMSLSAIGFISIRNKFGHDLFCALWPESSCKFQSIFGKDFFQVSVFLSQSSRKFEKKYGLHKLQNILENQSGETWAFTGYFVSLEI